MSEVGDEGKSAGSGGAADTASFACGDEVERELEGLWFPCVVLGVEDEAYRVGYVDDGATEDGVPPDELRRCDHGKKFEGTGAADASVAEAESKVADDPFGISAREREAMRQEPKVVRHDEGGNDGAADMFIINGKETNTAAGSGLRGLRWLRDNRDVQTF